MFYIFVNPPVTACAVPPLHIGKQMIRLLAFFRF